MSKYVNNSSLGRLWLMIKRLTLGMVGAAALMLAVGSAHAQNTGSISGTVMDPTGAVVPGATVVATNEASKAQWRLTSGSSGFFNFAAVPSATYSVRISRKGFETWTVTGILVNPGDSVTVPKIALKIGAMTVNVMVTAESAGVTLDSPEHSTLITAAEIDRLSTVSRDVSELVNILPGFVINGGTSVQNAGPGGIYGFQTTGPGSSNLGSLGANGSAPQQGLVNITSDGANIIDPGDMGGQLANVNMAQVQEVKVDTADFSASESKGPIVINAVGKSGTSQFHGGLYTYYKDTVLNSNDWLSNYYGTPRPTFKYNYPGGTLSGPVLIPHTNFNHKKNLTFFVGYEYYDQNAPEALATAFVPTAAMLKGDLSTATLASGLNVLPSDLAANCSASYSQSAEYTNLGGICYSPNGQTDEMGDTVTNGQLMNIDPATQTISSLWPTANRTPQPVITAGQTQFASDGINYAQNVESSHNGFQLHTRVDENFTDTLKFYAVYNWERVNDESQMNNIYYNPGGTVPYPTPLYSYGHSHSLTLDLTKIVGSTLTNDLMVSGVYYDQPVQFADPAKVQTTGTAWGAAGYSGGALHLNETQLPRVVDYESTGLPSFSFGYVPPSSQFLKKFDWNVKDDVTEVYKTHTFKAGIYVEEAGNNNATLGSQVNGTMSFMRWDSCYINQAPPATPGPPVGTSLGNIVANFLSGCPLGYSQDNFDPNQNLRYGTIEGYLDDQWKVNSKLTLTLGMRFSHLEPWTDPHGIGLAVWNPSKIQQHVLYPDTTANTTWPGISWHKQDPSIPVAGVPTRLLFYAPRVGLAYDLYGNGKTVIRGGWGAFYSHDSAGIANGLGTAIGLQTFSNPATITCTFGQLFTSTYVPCGAYSTNPNTIAPFTIGAMDPKDDNMPVTYNYNLTVDQRGPWKTTFELAYVANQSSHQSTLGNLQNQNVIPLGAFFAPDPVTGQLNSTSNIPNSADYRPYPNYQQVNVANHIAWSNYNSLQLSWNRTTGSLVWGANYTWSKALGVRGNYDTGYIGDPIDPQHDYGIEAIDRPQVLNVTYSWTEGTKYHGSRLVAPALNGWGISGINQIMSGMDLSVVNGQTNYGLSGGVNYTVGTAQLSVPVGAQQWLGSSDYSLQPVVTCNPRAGLHKDQFVNGNCFGLPAQGQQGWWNLPDVHGPAFFKADLTVTKDFTLGKQQNMQFRLSGFNFLNHPLTSFNNNNLGVLSLLVGNNCGTNCTYSTPTQALANATIINANTFGSTEFKNGVRIVELGFRYNF